VRAIQLPSTIAMFPKIDHQLMRGEGMSENKVLDLAITDVSDVEWEAIARRLAGVDFGEDEVSHIQACCGSCCDACDDCFHWPL